ncbi:MAG: hypothetical protein JRI72_12670 [Deltaproteobacteria bacterium]|nr:hypothetical protein [Deltaproteobacteria bacterium]
MAEITQKQRFLGTLLGTGSDRFPFFDLEPEENTLRRWHRISSPILLPSNNTTILTNLPL